tara:strand:- start:37 stop:525 length:489 start_codon:yes stop_codon:yes gene_type:complete
MGQVYILKLSRGKWYVGYTDRAIKRVLQHAEKKGAKWTKKYRPVEPIPYSMSEPIYSKEDEDRITLSLMSEHGIRNVRGGKWCMVEMKPHTVREIEVLLGKKAKPEPKPKTKAKPKPKTKPKTKAKPKTKKKQWTNSSYKKDRYGQLVPKTADDYRKERENR